MNTYTNNLSQLGEYTVAQLVIEHPSALGVFNKYNIDYCCGGHRSLAEACGKAGVDTNDVLTELDASFVSASGPALRPETWSSATLINFIQENHHAFIRHAVPELEALLEKVCARHGQDSPVLLEIRDTFLAMASELMQHMNKEELVLFPALRRLGADTANAPLQKIIQNPITVMEDEHVAAGNSIKRLRALTNNYTPPDYACMTYRVTFQKLHEFDEDLMLHVHLENNILFSRFKVN